MGGRDRARRHRGTARRRGGHRDPAPGQPALPHPDDPRGRKPAQRRQRTADLPRRRRPGCRRAHEGARVRAVALRWRCSAASLPASCSRGSGRRSRAASPRRRAQSSRNSPAPFMVWIVAEHIGLSGILTIVAYAITIARTAPERTPARLRVASYAVWETVGVRAQRAGVHSDRHAAAIRSGPGSSTRCAGSIAALPPRSSPS